MCKESPGSRCSSHTRVALKKAQDELDAARLKFPADSIEIKIAERNLKEAQENFYATPDGLSELKELNSASYLKYQKTRDYQNEALNEVRSGRLGMVSELVTGTQSFYDEDEVKSIVSSTRKIMEAKLLSEYENGIKKESLSDDEKISAYTALINNYESYLQNNQQGSLTVSQMETLTKLRAAKAPQEESTLETYRQVFSALAQSKKSMKKELNRIAILQDVSPQVTEAYHDAYRQEYKAKYAPLEAKLQPNPPKEWVDGSYSSTGFKNDTTTHIAPSDPASMYATYRLRSDMKAIPDYLKNSRNLATISVENEMINLRINNSKGKELESLSIPANNNYDAIEKLQGRIIILDNSTETRQWLLDVTKKAPLKSSILSTTEMTSKQLNLPDNSLSTFSQAMKVTGKNRSEVTMNAYVKARKQVESKWNSKAQRRNAPPLAEMPLSSRWA